MLRTGVAALRGMRRVASVPRRLPPAPSMTVPPPVQALARSYCVASTSSTPTTAAVDAVATGMATAGGAPGGGDDSEEEDPLTPTPGGPYDGVTLEPYEILILDRYGEEYIKYSGKLDTRPLEDLDFAEIMGGKYYQLELTEDQIHAYVFDTISGVKRGSMPHPEFMRRMKEEMKKVDPDTFGRFGLDHDDDYDVVPSKRDVFKLTRDGRPQSSAFFTTSPVYYEEMDRLKTVLSNLNSAIDTTVAVEEEKTATAIDTALQSVDAAAAKASTEESADTADGAAAASEEPEPETKRPVIPGENRLLTWDEKMQFFNPKMEELNFGRKYSPWVDDDGVNFFHRREGDEDLPMVWHTQKELVKALGSPFTKAQYRRLLRYARMIHAHPEFDEDAAKTILSYRRREDEKLSTTAKRRPLDRLGQAYATGRKKNATAVAYLKAGTGEVRINKKTINEFCGSRFTSRYMLISPFIVSNTLGNFDVDCVVRGGGLQGQVVACRHGIAKAIENYTFNTKPKEEALAMRRLLKKNLLLQRDPRRLERQKAGQHGARAKKRWTKR